MIQHYKGFLKEGNEPSGKTNTPGHGLSQAIKRLYGGSLLAALFLVHQLGFAQTQEKWEPVSLVSEEVKDFFAAREGNAQYPEAANFMGGEGGQWPQAWAISNDGEVLLWGTDVGGMARSIDEGASWQASNYGFNARGAVAFAIDPKNPNRAIAIGGNSGKDWVNAHGIYTTSNLKAEMPEWTNKRPVNVVGYRDIREQVAYDPSSYDETLGYCTIAYWSRGYLDWYDGETKHNAIYKTTDGGETWTELHLDNATYNLGIIKVHPMAGHVYLANGNGFFKSTDGAAAFTQKFSSRVTGMDVIASAGNEDKVFLSTVDGVYISSDAGESFSKVASTNYPTTTGSFMPASFLKVSPADPNRMMLQVQLDHWETPKFTTHDGGMSWVKAGEGKDNLHHLSLLAGRTGHGLWHPTDASRSWVFGGDFMQTSFDGGKTYRWSHNGLPAVMAREFNFSTTTPGVFVIPTQDYDVSVTKDDGDTWKYLNLTRNGWGGYVYGAYSSNGEVVFGIENKHEDRSKFYISITWDGGATTTKFESQQVSGYKMAYGDPHDARIFFAGEYRSVDEGHSWTKMTGCSGVFTSSPTGNKELYGVSGRRTIVRSVDKGATWVPIGEIPNDIHDIAYDHQYNKVYATTTSNLYELKVATKEVTNISGRTPANQYNGRRFYQVAVDPVDPNVVYLAAANHIFANDVAAIRSTDAGQSWIPLTRSPRHNNPQFGIDGGKEAEVVRVNPRTREAVFGTNCYGTWKIGAPMAVGNAGDHPDLVITDIQWKPENPKAGETLTFTATVKNNGTVATAAGDNLKVLFSVNGTAFSSADYTDALAVNGMAEITGSWSAAESGNFTITAEVDADELISEKSDDNNGQSASLVIRSGSAPAGAENLQVVSASKDAIVVEWESAANPEVIGYRVYLDGKNVDFVSGTTYTFTGLTRYTEYSIEITALDATGSESEPAGLEVYTAARASSNTVPKVGPALAIDGDLNESAWNLGYRLNKTLEGSNNNSTSFGMLWDDDNLYIAVKVMDDALHTGNADNWKNDGVQIYVNGNLSDDTSVEQNYWYHDVLAGKIYGNDTSLYELWSWNDNHLNLDDVSHKTKDIPGGYTMEFAIPWGKGDQYTGLGWQWPSIGKKLGVDVWNLDNDNGEGRRSIQVWNGAWENSWKGEFLGQVTLGPEGGDTLAPSVPLNLTATPSATKVFLSWEPSTDNLGVAEYFIYQDDKRIAEIIPTSDTLQTYEVTELAQGTAYTYKIKAVDDIGNVSDFSSEVAVGTLVDNEAPSVPANLHVAEANSTNITLSWDASSDDFGVEQYIIFSNATEIATTAETSFKVRDLAPLTAYTFHVKAVDEVGNTSEQSEILNVTTPDHRMAGADFIQTPLQIDGNLSDSVWADKLIYEVSQNLEGETNNEVQFGVLWDSTNLYVAVKVLDGQVYANPGQFWSTDALEIYVDANNNRGSSYDEHDRQFTRVIFDGGAYGSGGPKQAGVQHAWDTIDGGYVMEISIPWTNLGLSPVANMELGFDIGNNDDDNGGGRDGVLMWNGTGNNWQNTTAFGKLVLQPLPETACTASGTILMDKWNGIKGKSITDLTDNLNYPNNPDESSLLKSFGYFAKPNAGKFYGSRISGYVCVPETGTYTFWITGGESAELWLSTDKSKDNKERIAYLETKAHKQEWETYASQKSVAIQLEAGKSYYIEALYKEHSGKDYLAVGWALPDGALERPISGDRLSPVMEADPAAMRQASTNGVNNLQVQDQLQVYPIPVRENLTIRYFSAEQQEVRITLVDMLSKTLFSQSMVAEEGTNTTTIDVSQLNKGLYLVTVEAGGQRVVKKILITP